MNIHLLHDFAYKTMHQLHNQLGWLKNHCVVVLKCTKEKITSRLLLESAVVYVVNMLFFEIALSLVHYVNKFFFKENTFFGSCVVISLFSSTWVGLNIALIKALQTSLHPMIIVSLSVAGATSYWLLKEKIVNF